MLGISHWKRKAGKKRSSEMCGLYIHTYKVRYWWCCVSFVAVSCFSFVVFLLQQSFDKLAHSMRVEWKIASARMQIYSAHHSWMLLSSTYSEQLDETHLLSDDANGATWMLHKSVETLSLRIVNIQGMYNIDYMLAS